MTLLWLKCLKQNTTLMWSRSPNLFLWLSNLCHSLMMIIIILPLCLRSSTIFGVVGTCICMQIFQTQAKKLLAKNSLDSITFFLRLIGKNSLYLGIMTVWINVHTSTVFRKIISIFWDIEILHTKKDRKLCLNF